MMFCIYPIVAKHFEMFFGDMDNEFLNEVQSRNGFSNSFIVFVSGVMKSNIIPVIRINTRSCNYRSAKISADVFNSNIRFTMIRLGTNIESFGMFVYISFLTLQKDLPILLVNWSRRTFRKELRRKRKSKCVQGRQTV